VPSQAEPVADGGGARAFLRRFLRNRNAVLGAVIVGVVALVALAAPWIAPFDYRKTDMLLVWEPPNETQWLGADALGRDILSRLVVGARVSLAVAVGVLAITLLVGVTVGMAAAWVGGRVDGFLMRIADMTLAFPELIVAILVAAMLGPGVGTVVLSLAIVGWPGIARITRALVLGLRNELYVDAAIAAGTRPIAILIGHCLPNIVAPLIVRASVGIGFVVMAEATLSFLGIGIQEPLPTWGGMIRDGLVALRTDPHMALAASAALGVTIIGFNLLGDGLRDLLDPRLRDR
jgi:ABC-type dipeptide/oligopeptide/nickel transport system permease subunit